MMYSKLFRVQFLPSNQSQSNCHVQINPKAFQGILPGNDNLLKVGMILEISKTPSGAVMSSSSSSAASASTSASSSSAPTFHNQIVNQAATSNQFSSNQMQNQSDDESSPIIFQIVPASLQENLQIDIIRIDSAASQDPFSIKQLNLKYVNVAIIQKEHVTLDLIELVFKDQYLNGSDQWRIKTHMTNTCVHFKKNIEFCGMRLSVREMWMNGQTVTCGYISESTRVRREF